MTDTLPAVVAEQAARRGDHALLIGDDDVLTYADAEARSAALAEELWAAGVRKRTHVGVHLPNGSDFVVAAFAIARLGAVTLPISTFSTPSEIDTIVRNADVDLVLPTDDLGVLKVVERPSGHPEPMVRPADRLVIVHTSGSTGVPKGVIHQHGPLLRHLRVLNELRRYGEDEILFSNSPFFWIAGYAYSLLGTLLAGATLVCSNAADPADTLDLLERTRPTMCNGFAATVARLAKHPSFPSRDLSSIRRGNLWPIMPPDIRPADPELRHNMLGTTETGSVCLASDDESDQPEHRRGSFGKPVPGLEAKLVEGELWLRGPSLMEGYYGRERHEVFTPDGWYRTGDLFRVDDDGFFYFLGRAGDMIKTSGANVAPREVEAAILQATGLVAHVIGIDDADRGQLVAAAVRVPSGQDPPDEDVLRAALRERISAFKVPKRFLFLADEDVPMLSTGKLDSSSLKAMFG